MVILGYPLWPDIVGTGLGLVLMSAIPAIGAFFVAWEDTGKPQPLVGFAVGLAALAIFALFLPGWFVVVAPLAFVALVATLGLAYINR